jgi:hypothetical protein
LTLGLSFVLYLFFGMFSERRAMNATLKAYLDDQAEELENDVRQAIALAGGDAIQALRITLIANAFTHESELLQAHVSKGFVRSKS